MEGLRGDAAQWGCEERRRRGGDGASSCRIEARPGKVSRRRPAADGGDYVGASMQNHQITV